MGLAQFVFGFLVFIMKTGFVLGGNTTKAQVTPVGIWILLVPA